MTKSIALGSFLVCWSIQWFQSDIDFVCFCFVLFSLAYFYLVCFNFRSFVRSLAQPFVLLFVRLLVRLTFRPFVRSSFCSFVRSFVRLTVPSFVRSLVGSFGRSFDSSCV